MSSRTPFERRFILGGEGREGLLKLIRARVPF